jgi:immune inhibitor A
MAQSLSAVPFRPDVEQRLKQQGEWESIIQGIQDARARGLDQPPMTARGWLAAGSGLRSTERQSIVILVDFDDNEADQGTYPPSHYEEMLFSVGTYPTGSMRDWYLENSYGAFNATGTVTIWYRMPELYSYYVDGQAGFGDYPRNAQKLAEDAVAAADPDIDFSQFDNDGPDGIPNSGDDDGYVDALFVVHAGPGREQTGSDDDIHSHAWGMSSPQPVDGVLAYGYSMEPEDGRIGVFGHEFGHVLGLPDLYDTDYSSSGIGHWGMMSFGSWGGGGETPTHFIAWCKAELGFLDPVTPLGNVDGAQFPEVETNPLCYKLWTNGMAETEYFMVENRQRIGFDVSLPGDGLLIYHIDEVVGGNQNENHPLVFVEQADGRFDLQNGNGSDDGDPYPGSTQNFEFSEATVPSSNDYNDDPTQVAVYVLTQSQALMMADLVVETEPNVMLASWVLDDTQGGDGDGGLDPGESVVMGTTVRNIGLDVMGLAGTLTEPGGQGLTITQPNTSYGDMPADTEATGVPPFEFSLDEGVTLEAVTLNLELSGTRDYSTIESLLLGVSDELGFFEWDHAVVTPGFLDQWHISTEKNHTPGGIYCWKFGDTGSGNYADSADGALETKTIGIGEEPVIFRFWHWIEAEAQNETEAWDGGILEASVDQGPWTQIEPVGGYTHTIIANPASPFPGGTPCFSGVSTEWTQIEVDLTGIGSTVKLRWRFGSDGFVTMKGWYIDDVTVEGELVGAPDAGTRRGSLWFASPSPNPTSGGATLAFGIPSPGVSYRLEIFDLSGRLVRSLASGVTSTPGVTKRVVWDGRSGLGYPASSGLYFARLQVDGHGVWTRKVVVTD